MKFAGHSVLITGGATGIGFALAERFLDAGSEVIICGRREEKLRMAQQKHPQLRTRVCDVASEADRLALFKWTTKTSPKLDVLVNNAGIQRRIQLTQGDSWKVASEEIAINLDAPLHLTTLFIPYLLRQAQPALVNITSGLSFVPMASAPIYSATKAALHSFTLSLRHQLSKSNIQVVEIIPPAVNTDLGGPGLHTFGVPLEEFIAAVAARLEKGESEIAYGFSEQTSHASRSELDGVFARLNQR
jgi:uncharacterized oxidoreductase